MSSVIEPYRAEIAQADLDDLRARLNSTRWPDRETVDDWSQGARLETVQELCRYWADGYDWRATEARLNAFPQFTTEIDGLRIHFVHVRSPHPDAVPLLLTHGWPSSIVEYLDLIQLLTDPPDPADAFHVICPSLPGHGFGERPTGTGWTVQRTAEAWAALMARLGYDDYLAHGGDWGSWVSAALGSTDAAHLRGIHLTMPLARPPEHSVELDERDRAAMARMQSFGKNRSGYAAIQSTRPQALGYGLADSPAGQLAWILDRFWEWVDHEGDLDKAIGRDRLLDIVSMYWFTNTGASSGRLFWESFADEPMRATDVPTGCSVFPKDAWMPRAWARERFTDLRYWQDLPDGGHFPALERPEVLARELRLFNRALR
ncbi:MULTISPECIES: epoxide hydrolase family protein [Streptomyces]|uniref:Pimeloyl-ACP methyl ester carboxylesterase n=1 Tax=Streptomyces clavifer TaxID=68188 RepID=A0ABS4VA32_9ACTN|nr:MULTISPECIES: epoxide hydrolase family protein [Streptomyces]KQX90793.1 epoxide hydrolase [Streptomyces sp. Root1319]KQZ03487.1 epoxide hydrolase [Streptomyces sp. Root55]MBP2360778.1 pimeloyl-ACP methyl ester carboxylesterase [Streptomyces clavifer]MDX2746048.1 epoxide hydrolase [Streptomyces sp. NRRL_B-2557]MDX3063116.1 epoxide hydrolase [Streptomyces sp. ND04-05B]